MKITVIGTGYVGLVTGACLADIGNDVVCFDIDHLKVEALSRGEVQIHEPGLDEMVRRNLDASRLRFTSDTARATKHGVIQIIAVGTPADEDGSADLRYVLAAARSLGAHMDGYRLIVNKSTVPVGTGDLVRSAVREQLEKRGVGFPFHVVSNPEFLKEGAAIDDFMRPDRILVGTDAPEAAEQMRHLYAPFERNHPKLIFTDLRSAELTKYAANAMLATRISFMNQLALLAESVGADIESVRRGMGGDPRIGSHFLYAGCGYGGSCFPKDVKALIQSASAHGQRLGILEAVEAANEVQKGLLARKVVQRFGEDLTGLVIAVWGLSFKPNTDDMREAPSVVLIRELLRRGAKVKCFDPIATSEGRRRLGIQPQLEFCASSLGAVQGADALAVVTEWKEFRSPDFAEMKLRMRLPIIFDGRNIYDPSEVRSAGFEYTGIGRK
jgi:UDPglucose 6-dehydrogenase